MSENKHITNLELTEKQITDLKMFFSGKNTTAYIENNMLAIRGDFTRDILQLIPLRRALEVIYGEDFQLSSNQS